MQHIALVVVLSSCFTGQVAPGPLPVERSRGMAPLPNFYPPLPAARPLPPGKQLPGKQLPAPKLPAKKSHGPGGVRRDLSALGPDSQTMQSYRRAIEAMRRLPADDPHSLVFQGNIHGFPPVGNPNPNWGQCQHGNWWFFPWHRGYLVYLERIMRVYANDPSFCIPYWDYGNPQARTLPLAFRDPASPLYDSSRRPEVNSGSDQLDPAIVVAGTNMSMANTLFADFGPVVTFGGPAMNAPSHGSRPHGALESVPHDMIHGFVGGNMNNPDLAARDPVFLVHHSNIDRLWVEWLQMGQGRANPNNDVWLNQQFTYYDENKRPVTVAVRNLLDTAALGYTYERAGSVPPSPARAVATTPVENLVTVKTPGQVLGQKPVRLTLAIPENGWGRLQKNLLGARWPLAQVPSQVQVRLEGVHFSGPTDSAVAVYLNLPNDVHNPDPRSPYYAGCFTFFGHGHDAATASYLDVTKQLQRLWPYGDQGSREVTVTLVRVSCGMLPRDYATTCTCSQLSLAVCK